jgi:hypothetical protein
MVEINISKQVSKILSRFDRKISSSPTYSSALESLKKDPSCSEYLRVGTVKNLKEDQKQSINLKELYQESIGKYLKQTSPRSFTPDISAIYKPETRSTTPKLYKNTTQILKKPSNFHPKLNKNSLKIAAKLGDPKDRLLNSSMVKIPAQEDQFSYQPEINQKSKILAKSNGKQRWETLFTQGEEKRKDIEKLRKILEEKEKDQSEFIFKPSILQPTNISNPTETIERLTNWAKSREQKLKEKKDSEIDKDMKECTFMPRINEIIQCEESIAEIKGVTPYIERGKKIKSTMNTQNTSQMIVSKDLNKKKYTELVEALHQELQSLEL